MDEVGAAELNRASERGAEPPPLEDDHGNDEADEGEPGQAGEHEEQQQEREGQKRERPRGEREQPAPCVEGRPRGDRHRSDVGGGQDDPARGRHE
jgi:hypothetical protein